MPFAAIVGHARQIELLRRIAREGRLAHSLLLAGPPGVGKRLVAGALAELLLCEEKGADACGRCDSCRQLAAGSHPDVLLISLPKGKREIPIDRAREVNQFLRLKPLRGEHKVALVDDAHLLNLPAQNALLKGLEEPPPGSLAILVAHNPDALLPTIRSRCQRLVFAPLDDAEVAHLLAQRLGLSPDEAARVAAAADGSPGRALELAAAGGAGAALPALADLGGARYGALVQLAARLADSDEKAVSGVEAMLRSCHAEAASLARAGDAAGAARASDAGGTLVRALAALRRRGVNRALLLETTLLRVAERYGGGRRS